jgi:hypothetical protein
VIKRETVTTQILGDIVWNKYFQISPQSLLRGFGPFSKKVWDYIGEKSRYRYHLNIILGNWIETHGSIYTTIKYPIKVEIWRS